MAILDQEEKAIKKEHLKNKKYSWKLKILKQKWKTW